MLATPNSTSILLEWDPPLAANSAIENYIVRHRQLAIADCNRRISGWNPIYDLPADETSFMLTDLYAYSQYMVKVWVRTERHKKGQQVSKNVTTLAVGEFNVTECCFVLGKIEQHLSALRL